MCHSRSPWPTPAARTPAPGSRAQDRHRSPRGQPELTLSLPSRADAPALARSAVSSWCEELPIEEPRREVLRLLVSELVTNAVVHSRAHGVRLAASLREDGMLVAVSDGATAGPLPALRAPGTAGGGFGLHLVEHEAERWGVERAAGTRVWFVLDV